MKVNLKANSLLIFSIILFNLCSCDNKENINSTDKYEVFTGTLVNSLFEFGSFYDIPDSVAKEMKYFLDSLSNNSKDTTKKVVEFIESYNILKNNSLLFSPFIELKLDSNELYNVYLAEEEYNKVKPYLGFNKGRRKNIIIKLKGTKLNSQIIDCTNGEIISIEKLNNLK